MYEVKMLLNSEGGTTWSAGSFGIGVTGPRWGLFDHDTGEWISRGCGCDATPIVFSNPHLAMAYGLYHIPFNDIINSLKNEVLKVKINISNHQSIMWTDEQLRAAGYSHPGNIMNIPFPAVPVDAGEFDLIRMRDGVIQQVRSLRLPPCRVHVAGEPVLTVLLVRELQGLGYIPVAAITTRESTEELVDGKVFKRSVFQFHGWRQYPLLKEVGEDV